MDTLILRVQGKFAAFWYNTVRRRASSIVMPPSTAYGLMLNVANIDTDLGGPLPNCDIAVGLLSYPGKMELIQQLHISDQQKRVMPFGRQTCPKVLRREYLVDYNGVVAVRGNPEFISSIEKGLHCGEGLLFLGDNDCLADDVSICSNEAIWFVRSTKASRWTSRLTTRVDHTTSQSQNEVFMPFDRVESTPPESAWVSM
jgi:CRISPR-associated protein Cas5t